MRWNPAARWSACRMALAAPLLLVAAARAAEPLSERIDRATEAEHVGPLSPLIGDAEFVRRAYLDLVGRIPTAAEARAFLSDAAPGKRAALVDRLLADPSHARWLAILFDVMWMERRGDKHVPSAQWRQYLLESFAANKPYDQLAREILAADGGDAAPREAVKFYLDRDAEPHLVTRDLGRMFFGMDLQCCQCHDHPLIDDYYQSDYYGLYSLIERGFVFTAKDKKVYYAEKGEGNTIYQSVFDKSKQQHAAGPHLPGGPRIDEPSFAKGDEYSVKPADGVRPVPKFSRRAELARHAPANRAFQRNAVNRLWALVMGRGLVDPPDLHHSANPPVHGPLLDLLADEFVALKYDVRAMVRAMVLTRTYQRSIDLSAELVAAAGQIAARMPDLTAERDRCAAAAEDSKKLLDLADASVAAAQKAASPFVAELAAAQGAQAEAKKAADAAAAAVAAAQADLAARQQTAQALAEAAAKGAQAAAQLTQDKELAQAAATFRQRAEQTAAAAAAAAKLLAERQAAVPPAAEKLAAADKIAAAAAARLEPLQKSLDAAREAYSAAAERLRRDARAADASAARLADADLLVHYSRLAAAAHASGNEADRSAAETAKKALVERYARKFAAAELKPLMPEQLAWSLMTAVGMVDAQRSAAEAEWSKKNPAADPARLDAPATLARQRAIEQFIADKLSGNVGEFVRLFAAGSGQPQGEFFATADQSLFVANGDAVRSWIAPAPGNLCDRLLKIADAKAFAEELYLSILTRPPTDAETAEAAAYLASRPGDQRSAAVQELIWALAASVEFRFNH